VKRFILIGTPIIFIVSSFLSDQINSFLILVFPFFRSGIATGVFCEHQDYGWTLEIYSRSFHFFPNVSDFVVWNPIVIITDVITASAIALIIHQLIQGVKIIFHKK